MEKEKRLIDAVRFQEVLDRYINAPHVTMFNTYSKGMRIAIETCIELLQSQRTVDAVEVVHGRWEIGRHCYGCSVCKNGYIGMPITNYCPNCGAKMDGDGNG